MSIESRSTKSSRIRLSPGLRIPASWQHALRARLVSKNRVRNLEAALRSDSQKTALSTEFGKGKPGNPSASDPYRRTVVTRGYRTTRSCSADPLTTVNAMLKPLPRPPDSMLRPSRQSSYFNLRPNISTFGKSIDTNFLSSLEQQVLQSVQLLSEPPMTEANVLVQLGVDAFWMSRRDAGMLERINNLTEHLSSSAKAALLRDLNVLLKAPYQYPLQQVIRHGVEIIQVEPQIIHEGDNESLIDMYSDVDRYTKHLLPAPLRINKADHSDPEKEIEPPLHGPKIEPKNARKLQVEDNEINKDGANSRHSGSVARARAGLSNSQQARSETKTSGDIEGTGDRQQDWTEELAADIAALKQPGSVRNARNKIFENPREAPKPPVTVARPNRRQQTKLFELPSVPGSVGRARIAAENARSRMIASDADLPVDVKNDNPADDPKPLGSVARARIAAENALQADTTKTSDEPAAVQARKLVPVSSLPALKPNSTDAGAVENLRSERSGPYEFPERLSSLPLRSVEERRRNCKKGLSPLSGHIKAASTNVISGIRNWNTTTGRKVEHAQNEGQNSYTVAVDGGHKARVPSSWSPDLLTGSPLFAPASATVPFKWELDLGTEDSSNAATPIKPIFDIHQAVTRYDQFRLRGGASSDEYQPPTNVVKRRISTLLGKVTPLNNDERPPKALWWLAGGRTGGARKVPTAGELRERRKVEEVNREVVGYIGTVFGARAVRRLPMKDTDAEDEGPDDEAAEDNKGAGLPVKSAYVEDEVEDKQGVGAK